MISIKDGVRFHSPAAAMAACDLVVMRVCDEMDIAFVITGGIEEHEPPSKHVTGGGRDYRANHITDEQRDELEIKSAFRCGDGFDVMIHGEGEGIHLHSEYDPKN